MAAANRRRKRIRSAVIFGAIVVVAIAGFFAYRGLRTVKPATIRYTTEAVAKMTLTQSVSGTGNVELGNVANVTPDVSGTVSDLAVKLGDTVMEGQSLFTLVNPQLDLSVVQAENSYNQAVQQLNQAKLSLLQAKQNLSDLQDQYSSDAAYPVAYIVYSPLPGETPSDDSTPLVTRVQPTSGPTAGGTEVTITGSNFTGATEVKFGTKAATDFKVKSSTKIVATSPPGSGTVHVTVTTPFGTSAATTADKYTYRSSATTTSTSSTSSSTTSTTESTSSTTEHPSSTLPPTTSSTEHASTTQHSTPTSQTTQSSSGGTGGGSTATTTKTVTALDIKIAKQQVTNAELSITSAEGQIDAAQLSLQEAKDNAAKREVKAPIGGKITAVNVEDGDEVGSTGSTGGNGSSDSSTGASSGSSASLVISNLDEFSVTISLTETDIPSIEVGQKAILTFDALPDLSLTGKVTDVSTSGTVSQGVVSYTATITPDTANASIKGGMTTTANIITDIKSDVLAVPSSAIKSDSSTGGKYVQVLQNGSPVSVAVEVGSSNDSYTEITSGLTEGQEVITQTINPNASTTTTARRSNGGGVLNGGGGGAFPAGGGSFGPPPGG